MINYKLKSLEDLRIDQIHSTHFNYKGEDPFGLSIYCYNGDSFYFDAVDKLSIIDDYVKVEFHRNTDLGESLFGKTTLLLDDIRNFIVEI